MPLWVLDKELVFPPVETAEPDGLLAVGGDCLRKDYCLLTETASFPGMKVSIYYGGARIRDLFYFPAR